MMNLHLWFRNNRSILLGLQLFCLVYFSSVITVFSEEQQTITKETQQSPYENEPSYGEQSWIFEAINITGAWNMGYTGAGVRVRINDNNWLHNHTEWKKGFRLIHYNENAEEDYSCGNFSNKLGGGDFVRKNINHNETLNHGAAVTSILAADGNNNFCGTGIAPLTKLSFCNFDKDTTHPSVLAYKVISQELGSSKNSFDISMNAFAYEGCSSQSRGEIVGLHRNIQDEGYISSRRLQKQDEIMLCPFLNFYDDENNPGDDPCLVCTESDFDAIGVRKHRDNIFEAGLATTTSKYAREDSGGSARISDTCATSVRAYCSRNFRRDEALCTDWIDVINNQNICRFKNNVGWGNNNSLEKGAKEGRFGFGVIFIFAAGDSYGNGDNLNFQAYPKSRFVMTVGAVKMKEILTGDEAKKTLKPIHATYSTSGSSIFVVAPGGDYDSPLQHVGAGRVGGYGNSCINIGYGTSFAASVVGGVVALMLEVKDTLTYRDIRAIIAKTSKPVEIFDNENKNDDSTFGINAAGVGYSELYGFGLIDATAAVEEAKNWLKDKHTLPRELGITVSSGVVNVDIDDNPFSTSNSTIRIMDYQQNGGVLESVSVYLKLRYFNRGNLRITLTSPSGTTSLLSPGGRNEYGQLECNEWWEFLTLRSWGENPYGPWKLSITDTKPGHGDVVCMDRQPFSVPRAASNLNYTMTCKDYESQGFCVDGSINKKDIRLEDKVFNKTLFDEKHGTCHLTALSACCVCGGGMRPDDDEMQYNQLVEWKIVLGDGIPKLGTKRLSNYDPHLPIPSTYEFIRCRYQTLYGERLECCNGLEDICGLRVNEALFATLNNGMSEFQDGNFLRLNQEFITERALEAGYRAFKLDVCNCTGITKAGKLEFCFANMCNDITRREITDVMFYFREFFDRNPSEIALLFFEIRNDVGENIYLPDLWLELMQVMGLPQMVYVHDAPNSTTPWPTLREMISMDKRLIMFHHNGPNCTEIPLECPLQLHNYDDWVSDNNERIIMEPEEIEKRIDACNVQRSDMMQYTNTFVGLRNFVTPSSLQEVGKVNAIRNAERLQKYYAVQDYVRTCEEIFGREINFIIDDWWGVGDAFRMAQDHNMARVLGETWIAPTPAPTEDPNETAEPTEFPTWFPTFSKATPFPTLSTEPSVMPSEGPTGPYDPCPEHKDDCWGCKEKIDDCLWCKSTSTCYNRQIFGNIFDLDDEVLPCAGEDIVDSYDTTCAPRRPLPSVFDDDLLMIDDNNETFADIDDTEFEEIDDTAFGEIDDTEFAEIDDARFDKVEGSESPTDQPTGQPTGQPSDQPSDQPSTLSPSLRPTVPPVLPNLFGEIKSAAASLTVSSWIPVVLLSTPLLFLYDT